MKVDRYTKIIMTVLAVALLLNGVNPWIKPPSAGAAEVGAEKEVKAAFDCAAAGKNSVKSLEAIKTLERLLGYMETSVNNIQLAVNRIDRNMNNSSSASAAGKR